MSSMMHPEYLRSFLNLSVAMSWLGVACESLGSVFRKAVMYVRVRDTSILSISFNGCSFCVCISWFYF